jgi:hypothetical protein
MGVCYLVTSSVKNNIGSNMLYKMEAIEHDIERSLLQKVVRRGNVDLTEKVFKYLLSKDQQKWLRKRLAVFGYEECWTYANQLDYECRDNKLLEQYKTLACKVKNKNCDGLAYLAKRLNQYNRSALTGNNKEKRAIRTIANAIKQPVEFWEWVRKQPDYKKNKQRIDAAEKAMTKPHMIKDRVIMLAAAYLSVTYPIPDTEDIEPNNDPDFPYWIAIDKHTTMGEERIIEASESMNLLPSRGKHLGFFLEGAICNQIKDSPFFELAKKWQMNHMGYTLGKAEEKWGYLRLLLINNTKIEVRELRERLDSVEKEKDDELTLF